MDIGGLAGFFEDKGYPGTVAIGPSSMLRDYGVTVQSTKFGIARNGEIVFREGYGSAKPDEWRSRFETLEAT